MSLISRLRVRRIERVMRTRELDQRLAAVDQDVDSYLDAEDHRAMMLPLQPTRDDRAGN